MAKGDVVGVAAYPEEGGRLVVRLQHDDGVDAAGNPKEKPGDVVVWCSDRNAWCRPKSEEEISEGERRTFRNRLVPGEQLDPQPPQEPAELTPEIIERGVTGKARAILTAEGGGPAMVREYLQSRLDATLIDVEMAERIAERVGVPAPKAEG